MYLVNYNKISSFTSYTCKLNIYLSTIPPPFFTINTKRC